MSGPRNRRDVSPAVRLAVLALAVLPLSLFPATAQDKPGGSSASGPGPLDQLRFEEKPVSLTGNGGEVWCVANSPDGEVLASGSADKTVRLWDVHAGKLRATLKGHNDVVSGVAFSPDGKVLA